MTPLRLIAIMIVVMAVTGMFIPEDTEASPLKTGGEIEVAHDSVFTVGIPAIVKRNFRHSIVGNISRWDTHTKLMLDLYRADANDVVHITIMSDGGSVYTMSRITRAIRASKAEVIAYVKGHAYSAGAMIAFSADRVVMSPGSDVMFHLGSMNSGGYMPVHKVKDWATRHFKKMYGLIEECCSIAKGQYPLLTAKDMNRIAKGEDVYLNRGQVVRRLTDED